MLHMVFIIDHIHHLMNEFKIDNFAYSNDRRVYRLTSYTFTFVFLNFALE